MKHKWPIFDLKRYRKVAALRNGVLKLAMGDEAPRACLGKGGDTKR